MYLSTRRSFDDFTDHLNLLRGVYTYGFEYMSPVQQDILHPTQQPKTKSSSMIIQAPSGEGKTTGLILKVLSTVDFHKSGDALQGLVLVPNEFLGKQITRNMTAIANFIPDAKIFNYVNEKHRILITTPQRVIEKNIDLTELEILAIDEMSLMLAFGSESRSFIKRIFKQIPKETEIICTGASRLPLECYIHDERLKDSHIIQQDSELGRNISETFVYCPKVEQKLQLLKEHADIHSNLIFCNSLIRVEQVQDYKKDYI